MTTQPFDPSSIPSSEYWTEYSPEAGWMRRLSGAGQLGRTPYGQWLQDQAGRTYSNWLLNATMNWLNTGQPQQNYMQAAPQWQQGTGNWNQLLGLAPDTLARQMYETDQSGRARGFGAALGALRSAGAPGPLANWMSNQFSPLQTRWTAFHDPMAPDTDPMQWLGFLNQYMGI